MPRRYDTALLDKMKQSQRMEEYQGVPILVKPIPEGGQPGDMDPRLYKSMKWMPLLSHFIPKPKKDITILEKIQPYRKMFGQYKGDVVVSEGAYNPTAACGSKIKHQDFRSLDIGIAVAHFCLAAQAQGLATCILGWFDEKDLQRTLQIHHHIRVVIAVGIAAENDPHRPKKRKTLADIVDFR